MTQLPGAEKECVIARVQAAVSGHAWPPRIPRVSPSIVAHALALDMAEANAAIVDILNLSDERIVQAAQDIGKALGGEGGAFALPLDTQVSTGRPGSIEIAGRTALFGSVVPPLVAP